MDLKERDSGDVMEKNPILCFYCSSDKAWDTGSESNFERLKKL
jgi:hypothetical protein